ncbi:MAG: O-antigen ligase family protein [bacterium]|nr:O-antigen ligase family protein [bacterium]
MIQKFRESLSLLLIGALPLHALIVTLGTKLSIGPGHAPLTELALWKELVLGLILIFSIVEIANCKLKTARLRQGFIGQAKKIPHTKYHIPKIDMTDAAILSLLAIAAALSYRLQLPLRQVAFGFRYDFLPLIIFLIVRRVDWSEWFRVLLLRVILITGGAVAGFGILTFFMPQSFFTMLGYSDLHSLYLPGGPLAAFQQIGDSGMRRIQSTMSGPNQLGLWLLLPWSIGVLELLARFDTSHRLIRLIFPQNNSSKVRWFYGLYLFLIGTALLLTFSRSAWVAAAVIALTAVLMQFSAKEAVRHILRVSGLTAMCLLLVVVLAPNLLIRLSSSRDHILKPLHAMHVIRENPLGLGLGAAGPASNRVSDACVFLGAGADTTWAADRPNLCVFAGGVQVQPVEPACHCPFVTENWYLQIGVELGVVGMLVFLLLNLTILRRLYVPNANTEEPNDILSPEVFLPFLGISVAALFLHSWEGAAVAYSLWLMAGVAFAKRDAQG